MQDYYQEGQFALQRITGEEEIAQDRLAMVQPSIHERSIPFIEKQIFAFLGSEDANGSLWLSLLIGEKGFISVPSLQEVKLDLDKVVTNREDIVFTNIKTKPTVGLLFHQAAKRARYKAWGIASEKDNQLSFDIKMGYKSCPKHIQKERIALPEESKALVPSFTKGNDLGSSEKDWIIKSHTFFVTTQSKKGAVESAHRGGNPGFIEIMDDGRLRIPDYFGNSIYSTLGNIYNNPKAALLFIDYDNGETLQLSGSAVIQFDQNSEIDLLKSGETGRFWTFETKHWIRTANHHKVNSEFVDFSKFNIPTEK